MVAGMTGEPQTGDIHLNAMACEQTLVALWGAGHGERLRGLGDRFQVVFDRDGVRLHEAGASIDPNLASDWRAFIPWSDVERVGLASVLVPNPGENPPTTRNAITITANLTTIPLAVYTPSPALLGVLIGRPIDMAQLARSVNTLRGAPEARVNPVDLMREAVPELDPTRRRLAADPELPSRSAGELLGEVVRREPVYGPSSARTRAMWRRVQYVAGVLLAGGVVGILVSFTGDFGFWRAFAIGVAMVSGFAIRFASGRYTAAERIALKELEAGYTLSRSGPVEVEQLDPDTAIVIRRAGERALTTVEEKKARSAARLLDAGGPELPPSEWAILRARQIMSRGEDPEVAPTPVPEARGVTPLGGPAWGTGPGEPVPPRYPLLAGRHSRGIAWYRRADVTRRSAAEHAAGYTVSRTLRPDLDQVDPVSGYVIRPAGRPRLTGVEERAAMARVRMLPPAGPDSSLST
jgi:hypothetical protein